jgi:4-hydroxybenzoate polyprenyltransferase
MEGHPGEPGASIAPAGGSVRTPLARDPAASPRRWAVLALLRPHQWAKNFLVFLPLLLSHQVRDVHRWAGVLTAFVAFCLAASSVYVFNDWRDVEQDRRHPTKRGRPLASGRLPLAYGPPLSVALLGAAVLVSVLLLPLQFTVILLIYLAASTAYTAYFKSRLLVDVMVLAGLYTLRVLAGGAAGQAPVSNWMQAFSVFLFVSLAFAKRYTELTAIEERGETHAGGRGYEVRDLRVIESVGPASGYMAVLVLALYINDPTTTRLYPSPALLWPLCVVLMYWITRIWFFARRRALHEDPILFALRDRGSWGCLAVAIAIVVLASIRWPVGNSLWEPAKPTIYPSRVEQSQPQ